VTVVTTAVTVTVTVTVTTVTLITEPEHAEQFLPAQYEHHHLTILMQSLLQPNQDKTKKPVQPYYLAYFS